MNEGQFGEWLRAPNGRINNKWLINRRKEVSVSSRDRSDPTAEGRVVEESERVESVDVTRGKGVKEETKEGQSTIGDKLAYREGEESGKGQSKQMVLVE